MIVGLHGFAQSGKDTIGQELVEKYGFERLSFADIIREAIYTLNPVVSHSPVSGTFRVQGLVDSYGWEWCKTNYPEIRRLLQVMGTEVGRDLIYPAIWIDGVRNKMRNGDYVITDVRFQNEIQFLHDMNGVLIEIQRDIKPHWYEIASKANNGDSKAVRFMVEQSGVHASEWSWVGGSIDHVIDNTGTLDNLKQNLVKCLTKSYGSSIISEMNEGVL